MLAIATSVDPSTNEPSKFHLRYPCSGGCQIAERIPQSSSPLWTKWLRLGFGLGPSKSAREASAAPSY
ncbi:hypothetical protein NL676_038415 [Syzygium grande]|nr:hypothetical protein NL676_038415 [Syzygium grande]